MKLQARKHKRLAALLIAALLTGCQGTTTPPKNQPGQGGLVPLTENFQIHTSVPESQRSLLQRDISNLGSYSFIANDPDLASTLGVSDVSGPTLISWLKQRVKTIVGEGFSLDSVIEYKTSRPYSPQIVSSNRDVEGGERGLVIMVNLGAAIYLYGKTRSTLYQVDLGGGKLVVDTPRVGLLQVGEGMFEPIAQVPGHSPESIGNSLNRLAVLFHEARHSDGNGESVGFIHTECPPGHDYAGKAQCDKVINGAFAVESLMLRNFIQSCSQCDERERDFLRLMLVDAASRLIGTDQKRADPRPEKVGGTL